MRAAGALCLLTSCGFSLGVPAANGDAMIADAQDAPITSDTSDASDAPPQAADAPIDAQLCATPPTGMIAWWPGDTAAEIVANRTSTLVNGAMAGTAGKVGGAFDFDGMDDRVVVDDDLPALTEFTIEGWIDFGTTTASWRTVFANDLAGPGLWMKDRRINWFQAGADRFISNVTISSTGWHHFALAYGSDQVLRAYVDGVVAGTAAYQGASLPQDATIGGLAGYQLDGKLDELSIYDRALSATEITAIVTADVNGKCR